MTFHSIWEKHHDLKEFETDDIEQPMILIHKVNINNCCEKWYLILMKDQYSITLEIDKPPTSICSLVESAEVDEEERCCGEMNYVQELRTDESVLAQLTILSE